MSGPMSTEELCQRILDIAAENHHTPAEVVEYLAKGMATPMNTTEHLQSQIDTLTKQVAELKGEKPNERVVIYSDVVNRQELRVLSRSGSLWVETLSSEAAPGVDGSTGHYLNKGKATKFAEAIAKWARPEGPVGPGHLGRIIKLANERRMMGYSRASNLSDCIKLNTSMGSPLHESTIDEIITSVHGYGPEVKG